MDGKEITEAAYSSLTQLQSNTLQSYGSTVARTDKIVKAVEYVESTDTHYHFFVVLETDQRDMIVTEKRKDHTLAWIENPEDIERRVSLSKTICVVSCEHQNITVSDMEYHRSQESQSLHGSANEYIAGVIKRVKGVDKQRDD